MLATSPHKSAIDREVLALQAAAYPPDRTYVSTMPLLMWVRDHPSQFPELARRSDRIAKMEISCALLRLGFAAYSGARHNRNGNRAFARPARLLSTGTPQEDPQLSAAGGAP